MSLRAARNLVGFLVLLGLSSGCGDDDGEESQANLNLPVITPDKAWNSRPTAQVEGRVRLENGCLLMDGHVMFWPEGTTWDGDAESVVSDGEVWATVDEVFTGGGGWYENPVDYDELLGEEAGEAMVGCIDVTGATGAVFAYKTAEQVN